MQSCDKGVKGGKPSQLLWEGNRGGGRCGLVRGIRPRARVGAMCESKLARVNSGVKGMHTTALSSVLEEVRDSSHVVEEKDVASHEQEASR